MHQTGVSLEGAWVVTIWWPQSWRKLGVARGEFGVSAHCLCTVLMKANTESVCNWASSYLSPPVLPERKCAGRDVDESLCHSAFCSRLHPPRSGPRWPRGLFPSPEARPRPRVPSHREAMALAVALAHFPALGEFSL